jgi:Domain of unknown function (DUF4145)
MPGHNDVYCPKPDDSEAFHDYACAYCGRQTHGAVLALRAMGRGRRPGEIVYDPLWVICSHCGGPSVRESKGRQWPTPMEGPDIEGLPPDVNNAYGEARAALGAGSYTGCELVCRKVLMHVAVDVAKAEEGKSFASYIEALADAGYVTPPMRPWVDRIRENANEATHALPPVTRERALSTLMFTAELLRLTYEMSYLADRHASDDEREEGAEPF